MKYKAEDLKRLHEELYRILAEIIRVCEVLDIPYFIQGGTAIGALYNQGIVPWDDDIDIGMTRADYGVIFKSSSVAHELREHIYYHIAVNDVTLFINSYQSI